MDAQPSEREEIEPLWTVPRFAAYFSLAPQTVRNWLSEGKVHFVKIGALTRIPESEVRRLIAKSKEKPTTRIQP